MIFFFYSEICDLIIRESVYEGERAKESPDRKRFHKNVTRHNQNLCMKVKGKEKAKGEIKC